MMNITQINPRNRRIKFTIVSTKLFKSLSPPVCAAIRDGWSPVLISWAIETGAKLNKPSNTALIKRDTRPLLTTDLDTMDL